MCFENQHSLAGTQWYCVIPGSLSVLWLSGEKWFKLQSEIQIKLNLSKSLIHTLDLNEVNIKVKTGINKIQSKEQVAGFIVGYLLMISNINYNTSET